MTPLEFSATSALAAERTQVPHRVADLTAQGANLIIVGCTDLSLLVKAAAPPDVLVVDLPALHASDIAALAASKWRRAYGIYEEPPKPWRAPRQRALPKPPKPPVEKNLTVGQLTAGRGRG